MTRMLVSCSHDSQVYRQPQGECAWIIRDNYGHPWKSFDRDIFMGVASGEPWWTYRQNAGSTKYHHLALLSRT
ncbi:hypothetical protein K503DRAFT_777532 [Rhizopogon vinicolor AM-OR11-026]|uniref:Uncharacterized protein n=1 Tax=Rhizopogon vinicolor AM-OR11-026 TaxID=1314800 RepID=A0A1B7MFW3_9AGAM|nr:hypothetical protein K503DRAFT_777532 [Rhizopogon vinicolor AM-OR11-026]